MAENLRLNKRDKSKIRLSIAVLIAVILASMAAGYVLAQKTAITGKAVQENCIPQSDLQYFINQSNIFQNAYYKCEEDLWTLNFAYKQATVKQIK